MRNTSLEICGRASTSHIGRGNQLGGIIGQKFIIAGLITCVITHREYRWQLINHYAAVLNTELIRIVKHRKARLLPMPGVEQSDQGTKLNDSIIISECPN